MDFRQNELKDVKDGIFPHVYSLYIDLKMNARNSMFHLLVVVAGKGYVNS